MGPQPKPVAGAAGASFPGLDSRSAAILRQLVETYVETGEPVGSRTLSRRLPLNLSPATIRNVMADLEEAGLLFAPHTSAGRLPTERGLRLFVDGLLEFGALGEEERRLLGFGNQDERRRPERRDTLEARVTSGAQTGNDAAAQPFLAGLPREAELRREGLEPGAVRSGFFEKINGVGSVAWRARGARRKSSGTLRARHREKRYEDQPHAPVARGSG